MIVNGASSSSERSEEDDYDEPFPNIAQIVKQKASKLFSMQGLRRHLPVIVWLPKYKKSYILPDIVAGLTVALTVIPQGIADAALAGLPAQYGLYAGFMGCFVYFFFGSTKDLTIGPTAILSIMTFSIVAKLNADLAVFSTFISGCIIFLLGLFNLGFLMQFLSMPTICGFMNAATVTIASGQLRRLLGIESGKTNEFIAAWVNLVKYIDEVKWTDSLLGILSLILLMVIKKWSMKNKDSILLRYISISRNAIAVFGGILLAYIFHLYGSSPFNLTGDVASGLPSITLPPFSTTFEGVYYNFIDMIRTLGLSTFSLPLISIIEATAIAKSFNRGKTLDVTQEMIALGLCNLFSSFFRSIPITGSFTRSAVNNASGVKTPAGGIFTGLVVLLALGVLTQTFEYIPKASLAAVIIAAMFMMMNFKEVLVIWKTKRIDLLPFLGTFIMSLLYGLDVGILVGVGIDIAMTVYRMSRPVMNMEALDKCLVVQPKLSVNYSSAEYVKEKVIRFLNLNTHIRFVVIDGSIFSGIDLTAVKILNSLVDDCEFIGIKTYFWNWSCEAKGAMMRFDKKKFSEICKSGDDVKDFVENITNYDAKVIYI